MSGSQTNAYWEEVAGVAKAARNCAERPNDKNLLWLDRVFGRYTENEYRRGELAQMLREGLGEDYSRFCKKILLPRYRLSDAQLGRFEAHFMRAYDLAIGSSALWCLIDGT
jgi:hypothetical protein